MSCFENTSINVLSENVQWFFNNKYNLILAKEKTIFLNVNFHSVNWKGINELNFQCDISNITRSKV